jgi:ABC-type dipeptide/oligopeptide/nickel transport system ATPase component
MPELLAIERLRVGHCDPPRALRGGPARGDDITWALAGVSLTIDENEVVALVGESGSGKSTVAAAILGLCEPAAIIEGSIRLRGENLHPRIAGLRGREIALLSQGAQSALCPVLTVGQQLMDVLRPVHGRRPARLPAAELLTQVGLPETLLSRYPHQLSGGMRQRVALAIALSRSPSLLVLDEPTTALDVLVQREILALLAELRRRRPFALLFITHDLALAFACASRVVVLQQGRVVESGAVDEIRRWATHPHTRALLAAIPTLEEAPA